MLTAPVRPGSTRDVILVTVRGAVICTLRTSSASGRSFWNSNVCSTGAFSPTLPKLYEFEAVVWANAIVVIDTPPKNGSRLTSARRIIGAETHPVMISEKRIGAENTCAPGPKKSLATNSIAEPPQSAVERALFQTYSNSRRSLRVMDRTGPTVRRTQGGDRY